MQEQSLKHVPSIPMPVNLAVLTERVEREPLGLSDLRSFAEHFAREFDYNHAAAIWEPSVWYRRQVGEDVCSDAQAVLLREMTVQRCLDEAYRVAGKARKPETLWRRSGPALDDASFVLLALLVFLVGAWAVASERDPEEVPAVTHSVTRAADAPVAQDVLKELASGLTAIDLTVNRNDSEASSQDGAR